MTNINYSNIVANMHVDPVSEDLSVLKKKLKVQQGLFSDKIKTQPNPELKVRARSVHNEISKLRRKTNDKEGVLELMRISIETEKMLSHHFSINLNSYNALSTEIKQKSSRAWKILAGAMISFSLSVSAQV